jgi:hypothetical protein
MAAPKRNTESAKFDYDPAWQYDTEEKYQNTDPVKMDDNPSRDCVGPNQPDPWRHLDDQYKPEYPK